MRWTGVHCGFLFTLFPSVTIQVLASKMFQLGSLVVLCSLLIRTSDSLLGGLGNAVKSLDVGNAVKDLDAGNVVKDLDVGNVVMVVDVGKCYKDLEVAISEGAD